MTQKFPELGDIFEQRYELLEVLGAGGSGTVFKARQIDVDRLIALKVMHADKTSAGELRERFLREAQALNKLSHHNIVTVYHLGLSEFNMPFLAMELLKGVTLRKSLLHGGKLPTERVYKIMKQLCSALSCMHDSGIVHRDLKPDNIMLLDKPEPDTVKIIDFGLVKVEADSNQKLTATGLLIGSVNYMSPEQCQGLKADTRSDIYALAVCLYEMLADEPPFTSDNPVGLMYQHVHLQAPELKSQTGEPIDPAIRNFVFKGLEKNPDLRFQSASEMDEELSRLVEHFGGELPASRKLFSMHSQGNVIAIALLGSFTICIIAALFLTPHKSPSRVRENTAVAYRAVSFQKTEREYKRSLERAEKRFGTTSLEILPSLQNLGFLYKQNGRYSDETLIYKRALAIREKALAPNSPYIADYLETLADSYSCQSNFAAAEPLYKRAASIREKTLQPDLSFSLQGLANVYLHQCKYPMAEALYKRALAMEESARQDVLQPNVSLANSLTGLADSYFQRGKYALAEPLYKRAVPIWEKTLGPSERLAHSLECLAECSRHSGKNNDLK